MIAQHQAGVFQRVRRVLEPGADRGEQVQLTEILRLLARPRGQRPFGIVGLMLQRRDAVDRGQEVVGLRAAGGSADLRRMAAAP